MKRLFVAVLWIAMGASFLAAGSSKVGERGLGPAFKSIDSNFRMALQKMKTTGEMDYNKGENKFVIEMEGAVECPPKVDAVAVPKTFTVSEILDANGQDILKASKAAARTQTNASKNYTYNAFHNPTGAGDAGNMNPVAQAEISRQDIVRDVTKIKKMTIHTDVILAKKRSESKLPAIVMEDYKELADGIQVRVMGLEMSSRRELTVRMLYKRPASGPEHPFLEAVYLLDTEGKNIGGSRWTEGDPLGKSGSLIFRCLLEAEQVHKTIRIVIVTESETKTISFELKDMFNGK